MLFRRFSLSFAVGLSTVLVGVGAWAKDLPHSTSFITGPTGSKEAAQLSLSDLRKRLDTQVQPPSQATKELQNGYQKLNRVCTLGKSPSPPPMASLLDLSGETDKARLQLRGVELALQQVLKDYAQNSRITRLSACRYVPSFVPLSFTCEGFREDRARLDLATQTVQKLVSEANQRLDLYEQIGQLELRGCTRPGFSLKLWETEQSYLWPTLVDSPNLFRALLPEAALD